MGKILGTLFRISTWKTEMLHFNMKNSSAGIYSSIVKQIDLENQQQNNIKHSKTSSSQVWCWVTLSWKQKPSYLNYLKPWFIPFTGIEMQNKKENKKKTWTFEQAFFGVVCHPPVVNLSTAWYFKIALCVWISLCSCVFVQRLMGSRNSRVRSCDSGAEMLPSSPIPAFPVGASISQGLQGFFFSDLIDC